ncbi:hypothetical protein PHG31p175 [Aeromonas phage 31]|uniref:Uncharacterized protein PHG31ORF177c n=2 Tax=Biquartavirus TaxID=1912143 RepID=Q56EI6_9CAUD|nr:tRNA amidotransferase [Aeromonas phage 31]APU01068.1 hypothetical protein [Aeromonas phage 31.2]APU01978.1 hypothetical protein [Aeromonas phage L9-6]UYD59730.1 hypothetical protein JNMOADIG_00218 [Aeromonas phage avDM5]UYD60540.1 hypothetical protein NPHMPGLK_00205 [Aeromonas phage avDM2]AAX63664.1 hypothetical protein PHG31p175 [Aeromonas phage 31]
MTLFEQITESRSQARREHGNKAVQLLGLVIGEVNQSRATDDESVRKVILSLMKGINDRIENKYTSEDLVEALKEKEMLSKFLPQEITVDQFNSIVNGKELMDIHRLVGPNINALAGKLMGRISAGVKDGRWTVAKPKEMKKEIESYVIAALETIGV